MGVCNPQVSISVGLTGQVKIVVLPQFLATKRGSLLLTQRRPLPGPWKILNSVN